MLNRRIPFIAACIITCILLFSCKNEGRRHLDNEKKYQFSLRLNAGDKFYYTISNKTRTLSEVDDKKIESVNTVDLGLIYEVFQDTATNIRLKITYDKLHISMKNKNDDKEIDIGNTSSSDPVENLLSRIRGSSIFITLNRQGDVTNITGSKEISDKILATMNTQDQHTRKIVDNQLSKLIGEAFVKSNIEEGFTLFPDSAIFIGDSWEGKRFQTTDLQFDAATIYTLEAISNGIAEVEVKSLITNNNNTTKTVNGYDVLSDIKINHTGNFKADTSTGMVSSGKSITSIEGTLQVIGRTVPVEINISRKVEAKKII